MVFGRERTRRDGRIRHRSVTAYNQDTGTLPRPPRMPVPAVSSAARPAIRSASSIPPSEGITVRTGTDTEDNRQSPTAVLDTPDKPKCVK